MGTIQFHLSRLWVQGDIGWADVRPDETSAFSSDLVTLDGDFSVTVDGKPVPGIAPPGESVSLGAWLRQLHPLHYLIGSRFIDPAIYLRHMLGIEHGFRVKGEQIESSVTHRNRRPVKGFEDVRLDPDQLLKALDQFETTLKNLLLEETTRGHAALWWKRHAGESLEAVGLLRRKFNVKKKRFESA